MVNDTPSDVTPALGLTRALAVVLDTFDPMSVADHGDGGLPEANVVPAHADPVGSDTLSSR